MTGELDAFRDTHTLLRPSLPSSNRAEQGNLRVDFSVHHLRYSTWFKIDGGLGQCGTPAVQRYYDPTWYNPNTSMQWVMQDADRDGDSTA
jgi:hypothetical protein